MKKAEKHSLYCLRQSVHMNLLLGRFLEWKEMSTNVRHFLFFHLYCMNDRDLTDKINIGKLGGIPALNEPIAHGEVRDKETATLWYSVLEMETVMGHSVGLKGQNLSETGGESLGAASRGMVSLY